MKLFKSLRELLTPSASPKGQEKDGKRAAAVEDQAVQGAAGSLSVKPSRGSAPAALAPALQETTVPSPRSPPTAQPAASGFSSTSMPRSPSRQHSQPLEGSRNVPRARSAALPPVAGRLSGQQQAPLPLSMGSPSHARRMSAEHLHEQGDTNFMRPSRDSALSQQRAQGRVGHAPVVPQQLNMSADYNQTDDDDDDEEPDACSPIQNLSHALLKARLSQGSAHSGGKLNTSESLKSLLHLDQYSFFSDTDVQEAQLQVDTELLASLLIADESSPTSGASPSPCFSKSNILAVSPALPHSMRRVKWSLDDYVLLKQLHKGYASDVFHAQCKLSREMVALKVYKLAEQCDLQRVQLYREIRLHSQLQHTNVVQFYAGFLEDERVVLVQEFAGGGDLLKFMTNLGGRLIERQAVSLVLQPFLAALHYLHTQGIVHRDIKPENVLLTDNQQLKLADFGLAIDLNEERANTRAGTLDYMAPEVLRCPTKHTPDEGKMNPMAAHYQLGADAWAVGIFAYELITGLRPFKAKQNIEIARNIIHAQVAFPDSMSEMSKDFIAQALQKHPGDRPTVIEMLHHPWVTMFQRRSSVHYAYTRSNSLMEIMAARKSTTTSTNREHDGGGGGGSRGVGGGASGQLRRNMGTEHRLSLTRDAASPPPSSYL